jgi:hypothetical protein
MWIGRIKFKKQIESPQTTVHYSYPQTVAGCTWCNQLLLVKYTYLEPFMASLINDSQEKNLLLLDIALDGFEPDTVENAWEICDTTDISCFV